MRICQQVAMITPGTILQNCMILCIVDGGTVNHRRITVQFLTAIQEDLNLTKSLYIHFEKLFSSTILYQPPVQWVPGLCRG
jgi:hypothetical protein